MLNIKKKHFNELFINFTNEQKLKKKLTILLK